MSLGVFFSNPYSRVGPPFLGVVDLCTLCVQIQIPLSVCPHLPKGLLKAPYTRSSQGLTHW